MTFATLFACPLKPIPHPPAKMPSLLPAKHDFICAGTAPANSAATGCKRLEECKTWSEQKHIASRLTKVVRSVLSMSSNAGVTNCFPSYQNTPFCYFQWSFDVCEWRYWCIQALQQIWEEERCEQNKRSVLRPGVVAMRDSLWYRLMQWDAMCCHICKAQQ